MRVFFVFVASDRAAGLSRLDVFAPPGLRLASVSIRRVSR